LIHSRQRTEPRITRSGRAGTAITGAGSGPSAAPAAGSALHLAAAVAPAAHAAAVAGVAPVGDPLPEGAGAAAAEAAAVSVARRAGLHGLTTFRSCRGAVTGHTQCDMRYPGPRWRGTILDARAVRAAGAGPTATSGRRPRRDSSCRCRCRRRTWSSPTCPSGRCPCTRDTTRCPYRQGTASSAWVIPSRTDRCVHVTRLPERVRRPSPNVNVDGGVLASSLDRPRTRRYEPRDGELALGRADRDGRGVPLWTLFTPIDRARGSGSSSSAWTRRGSPSDAPLSCLSCST